MAEFQAMLAMYMNSTSIGYGSPAWAFEITMCIMPWAERGASQLNALSIRIGWPWSSSARSSGENGKPRCGPFNGESGVERLWGKGWNLARLG